MSHFGLTSIWPLWLLLLIVIPLYFKSYAVFPHPRIRYMPVDKLSVYLGRAWRFLGFLAILSLVLAMSGPYWDAQKIEKTGYGSDIMIVLDRSASMNDDFNDQSMKNANSSKMSIARHVLKAFIEQSKADLMGMVTFSTSPILVAPIGSDKEDVIAALNATQAGGMGFTAVARGLGMGLDYFKEKAMAGRHVILFVSDGAAHLDEKTRELLRTMFHSQQASLYWIYLRSKNGSSLTEKPPEGEEQSYPEYSLHRYFQTLGIPYRAFEAGDPQAVKQAMQVISTLKNGARSYQAAAPRSDISGLLYVVALVSTFGLLLLNFMEINAW